MFVVNKIIQRRRLAQQLDNEQNASGIVPLFPRKDVVKAKEKLHFLQCPCCHISINNQARRTILHDKRPLALQVEARKGENSLHQGVFLWNDRWTMKKLLLKLVFFNRWPRQRCDCLSWLICLTCTCVRCALHGRR